MKRILNGRTYTIEPETRPAGHGKRVRGHAMYSGGSKARRVLVGFAYKKADGWYCHGAGCDNVEFYGGGLMKDAMKSMLKGRK